MKVIFVFLFLFMFKPLFPQQVYFGFPTDALINNPISGLNLEKGDIIIQRPVPMTSSARLYLLDIQYFDSLKNFMIKHNNFHFTLTLNSCCGYPGFDQKFTDVMKKQLEEYLKQDTVFSNHVRYEIISNGNKDCFFSCEWIKNYNNEQYKKFFRILNNRLEIKLE